MPELTKKEQEAADAIRENIFDKGVYALYNAGYQNGFRDGQTRGYDFGRSAMTHWSVLPGAILMFLIGIATGIFVDMHWDAIYMIETN